MFTRQLAWCFSKLADLIDGAVALRQTKPLFAALRFAGLGAAAIGAAVVLTSIVDSKRIDPTAARIEGELNEEIRRIQAPFQSTLHHTYSRSKPGIAYVGAVYDTTLTYEEVRPHYDAQLSSQGWKYMHEEYLGARVKRCYSKGAYKAILTYENGFLGQEFSIAMNWGLEICY